MTCNTNSLIIVSRLVWKRFRWKFIDIFEDVCSLHTCFSADSFHLFCCLTPWKSSGRFWATRYILGPELLSEMRFAASARCRRHLHIVTMKYDVSHDVIHASKVGIYRSLHRTRGGIAAAICRPLSVERFFSEVCWRWNINFSCNEDWTGQPGADSRKNSMSRVDFRTHPIHALACMDDSVVCRRFFGNMLAMKYYIL